MNKNQNIVNYYGHNYPIWDVSFSPHDLYFATASNDRTARLWKSDHIYPLRIFAGHFSDVNVIFKIINIVFSIECMHIYINVFTIIIIMFIDCKISSKYQLYSYWK